MNTGLILTITTGLVLLTGLKAHADWAAESKDVTVGPGGTSVTTHLVPTPDKAKLNQYDQALVDTAKGFQRSLEAQREVAQAREVIVRNNPQSMFRLHEREMDDDGKISEFLKYYGYAATPINIDKIRSVMSQRSIQHVWDLVR